MIEAKKKSLIGLAAIPLVTIVGVGCSVDKDSSPEVDNVAEEVQVELVKPVEYPASKYDLRTQSGF